MSHGKTTKEPQDIRDRTFQYSLKAIGLYRKLKRGRDSAGWEVARQYLRSATSIGANVEEAKSGESRADFIHKYGVARKEANESYYWLRLIKEASIVKEDDVADLLRETNELIAILTAIILSSKRNAGKRSR